MKKLSFTILLILFIQSGLMAQNCLPDGIIFISQAQVDSFPMNYPGCTSIEGTLTIGPENSWDEIDIANLDSLIQLNSIEGDLLVWNNDLLPNLHGLDSLASIGGNLRIETNSSVQNLQGLENLEDIMGDLKIYGGNYITSLSGLDNLASIGGSLSITYNNALTGLSSLSNLLSIGGDLSIQSNASLTSLLGLDNINYETIVSLNISNNLNLSYCAVSAVCNYIASADANVQISNMTSGCANESQVNSACNALGIEEISDENDILIYPNPANDYIQIKNTGADQILSIAVYNLAGQCLLRENKSLNTLYIAALKSGVYNVEIQMEHKVYRQKIKVN